MSKAIDQIKRLRNCAVAFETFHETYDATYAHDTHCDKKGYGFGMDDRFAAFSIATSFASWRGYYGNSSCSTILSVDAELARQFVVKAMNVHQRELFSTIAKLMRDEAAQLTAKAESELEGLRHLLDDAKSGAAT